MCHFCSYKEVDKKGDDSASVTSKVSIGSAARQPEYVEQLLYMRHQDHTTLYVDFAHVLQNDPTLAKAILINFYRCGGSAVVENGNVWGNVE